SDLSLNLAVTVREPGTARTRFARVKVPQNLPRFLVLPDDEHFISLEDVIAEFLDELFPGMEIVSHCPFRVTRDSDFDVDDAADDLREAVESGLLGMRFGRVVRLEVEPSMSAEVLQLLMRELEITEHDVYTVESPLAMAGLDAVSTLDIPELRWPTTRGVTQQRLAATSDIFSLIRERDILVQHPYESFDTSVNAFIRQAARDPHVLAIKMSLYRTSEDTPIVDELVFAAEAGKQVVVLIELKARFDELANLNWARRLEQAGVHVLYGVVGLKCHSKTTLVVREEPDGLRRYAHVGTGNYNELTSRYYEDVGLFTCDTEIGADLTELFNYLTGYSQQTKYRQLLVAPLQMRNCMVEYIRREALEPDGRIVMKMNALVDPGIIDELYAASQAGTRIDLIVRGICCLRPGVPGLSENIQVRSIIGRNLEHSRIYRFGTKDRGRTYLLGSADMMPRNLSYRVEAIVPVKDPELKDRLEDVLDTLREDDELAWTLGADGTWTKVESVDGVNSHLKLHDLAEEISNVRGAGAVAGSEQSLSQTAGGVVVRLTDGPEVLVIHRPKFDDWTHPKGHLEVGEKAEQAAVREVLEETGITSTVGPELSSVEFAIRRNRIKHVRYWLMKVPAETEASDVPNVEVDEVRWLRPKKAKRLLTYERDRSLVDEAIALL
ncbi:MAG: polyphosphate kinase 1, partial [Acidimicrobiales bacterium]